MTATDTATAPSTLAVAASPPRPTKHGARYIFPTSLCGLLGIPVARERRRRPRHITSGTFRPCMANAALSTQVDRPLHPAERRLPPRRALQHVLRLHHHDLPRCGRRCRLDPRRDPYCSSYCCGAASAAALYGAIASADVAPAFHFFHFLSIATCIVTATIPVASDHYAAALTPTSNSNMFLVPPYRVCLP